MRAIPILISLVLVLIGIALLINPGGRTDKYHSIMGLAWGRMNNSSMNRAFRLYLVPGKVPLWVFRFAGATFFLAAGIVGLIASL